VTAFCLLPSITFALALGRGGLADGAAAAQSVGNVNQADAVESGIPDSVEAVSANHPQVSPQQLAAMTGWARSLALQAATYGAPIVAMYNLRQTVCIGASAKAPPGEIWRLEDIATPKMAEEAGYVSPNVNTLYGFGFLDLGQQPFILSVPDSGGRYYMVELVDMWTNAFAYAGGTATGYEGGKFALVERGWTGQLPPGVTRIDCPTRWVELQPRVHVKNEADLAAAKQVLEAITVQGLAQYNGLPAPEALTYDYPPPMIDPKVASSQMKFDDPLQFWSIFSAAMNENPPPENEIEAVLPQFKYLGIELGKRWTPESVNPLIREQMKEVATEIGPTLVGCLPLGGKFANGWVVPPYNVGFGGNDYLSRAAVAVFGLTANTPVEAIYYSGLLDSNAQPLTGQRQYTLRLTGDMQYAKPIPPGFWSVTMYDSGTLLTVPNPINRYSLGSDNDLKMNPDGSITIYIQQSDPGPDKEANWLPAPTGPFYLLLRNYAPVPEVAKALKDSAGFQGPPPLVPVGAVPQ
jgi:hypothetical protein